MGGALGAPVVHTLQRNAPAATIVCSRQAKPVFSLRPAATGDSAIIEWVAGSPIIYHNRSYVVRLT